jgi:hypothetical protein
MYGVLQPGVFVAEFLIQPALPGILDQARCKVEASPLLKLRRKPPDIQFKVPM